MYNLRCLAYDSEVGIFDPQYIAYIGNMPYAFGHGVPGAIEPLIKSRDIMIFTGCHDKNQNPIYSGHIIHAYDKRWEVVFSQGGFCIYRPGQWKSVGTIYGEIIGNKYQHAKLMYQK